MISKTRKLWVNASHGLREHKEAALLDLCYLYFLKINNIYYQLLSQKVKWDFLAYRVHIPVLSESATISTFLAVLSQIIPWIMAFAGATAELELHQQDVDFVRWQSDIALSLFLFFWSLSFVAIEAQSIVLCCHQVLFLEALI